MNVDPRSGWALRFAALVLAATTPGSPILADSVIMKNGMTFRTVGPPDKDGTLVFLWDGLKKTVIRDSKIERVVPDNTLRTGEKFQLVQPLIVHAGIMPKEVISVEAGPWNEKGRRQFRYAGSKSNRPIAMEQAINEIGPYLVRYRGVDGFWHGELAVSQVPRPVMMSLLHRVEQKNQDERERVVRYLMGAGWYPEAREELDRLIKEFPASDLSERAASARTFIVQAEATQRRAEVDVRRRAQQPEAASALLKTFTDKEIGTEIQVEVRDVIRRDDDQRAADAEVDNDLRKLELKLSPKVHGEWKARIAEVHKALDEAPDAVRGRLAAWRKARSGAAISDDAQLALAMSGYVVGHEAAVSELDAADALWKARDLIATYLGDGEDASREEILAQLNDVAWPGGETGVPGYHQLELASLIVPLLPPTLPKGEAEGDKGRIHNVVEAADSEPTEYYVKLPPEYHPLRSYPALVVLHSGRGPQSALEQWEAEAARRGYILIAPAYNVAGQSPEYRYSASEHAAVELALRDARKRYAVDSDRIFLAGQLQGGNMAWDFGLGHPDLFAGLVVVSGFPAKYVPRYLSQHERLPLICVLGDLAPASNEVVFANYVKPMILKTWDVTYMEFHHRGLEEFPEEIPTFFDWMDRRRRDPVPKAFDAVSARTCDDRRYGMVIRGFAEGRTTAPEAAEVLGQNLRPATLKMKTSSISNLVDLQLDGITQVDIWLSPKLVDFKRKLEIRINRGRKSFYKGQPTLELKPMLEDLRVRGDRQQIYWFKIAAG
ncbi:MAG: alpha/beta hydrolase [Paludisphaera borealis]|uniref:alpha/beta hydrolase n=1 Tax=Paludisphaera borealis TaxID=1387353 RepID=UPI00284899A7|nr:alpha/beta hydrolase [Paludisphaera borealis]MDR3619265.1 alpha/beta hydrolase [Paludisphaera borealis]